MQVLDSHSFADELHLLLRNCSRLRGALGEDAIDLRAILGKFSAILTHRCNHFFEIFRQEFFGLLVANAALAIAALKLLILRKERNGVAVALTHLASVSARDRINARENEGLRDTKDLAKNPVELQSSVAGNLKGLFLVSPDRDYIRVKEEDVRRHKHWVVENSHINVLVLHLGVLECMRALKVGNSGEAVKNPRKLGGEPHGGLRIEGHLARVQAGSEVVKRHVNGVLLQFLTVLDCSERMIISNKNERAVLILQINKLAHSAKVVAYVRPPGWLDAREEHLLH